MLLQFQPSLRSPAPRMTWIGTSSPGVAAALPEPHPSEALMTRCRSWLAALAALMPCHGVRLTVAGEVARAAALPSHAVPDLMSGLGTAKVAAAAAEAALTASLVAVEVAVEQLPSGQLSSQAVWAAMAPLSLAPLLVVAVAVVVPCPRTSAEAERPMPCSPALGEEAVAVAPLLLIPRFQRAASLALAGR